jgi:hypothetical protein
MEVTTQQHRVMKNFINITSESQKSDDSSLNIQTIFMKHS